MASLEDLNIPQEPGENPQSQNLAAVPGLQGESVRIEAANFSSGCTNIYNQVNPNQTAEENILTSKRKIVDTAKLLAQAIDEVDEKVIDSIFDDMENSEIIKILLIELQADFKSNAIRFACKQLHFDVLEMLLKTLSFAEKKAVLEHKGYDGLSAFHVAVERGNTDLVRKLLELQLVDPLDQIPASTKRLQNQDTKTRPGDTAFHIATRNGNGDAFSAMAKVYTVEQFFELGSYKNVDNHDIADCLPSGLDEKSPWRDIKYEWEVHRSQVIAAIFNLFNHRCFFAPK